MSRCVLHKDVLLAYFQYDFLVQLSFPVPAGLLYLVLSHSEVFLWSSYYSIFVLRAPKRWLLGWVTLESVIGQSEENPPALRSVAHNPTPSHLLYSVGHWKQFYFVTL